MQDSILREGRVRRRTAGRYGKYFVCFGIEAALLAAFYLCRGNRNWMNALADYGTTPLKRGLGAFCSLFPFSVMELLVAAGILGGVAWLVFQVTALIRREEKTGRLCRLGLTLCCVGLGIYLSFCLLWGVNYYTDSFQDRSGIRARGVAVEELYETTQYFAQRLEETAGQVERDENGVFAVSQKEIFDKTEGIYTWVEAEYPFLEFPYRTPKKVLFSPVMSAMGFTGVYCPFTGESNLNVDAPNCLLPATIAHELAHQRSVASEQECNFLAVLASTTCGDEMYAYSGWLLGYVYLSNALYQADKELWQGVWDALPEGVKADIWDNNAYWERFESIASDASQKVYDSFLKGYGQEKGIQSYGTVVDMLVVYYGSTTGK